MDEKAGVVSESALVAARELRVLLRRLRRRFQEVAAAEDLSAAETSVLARLAKEGPSSASALAGVERVRPQSMATTLAALERRGLIERSADPEDGRRRVVRLTVAGSERGVGAHAAREEWLASALQERYSEGERATITAALGLLDRLTQS